MGDDVIRVSVKQYAPPWGRKCESGVQKSDDLMSWFGAENTESEQKRREWNKTSGKEGGQPVGKLMWVAVRVVPNPLTRAGEGTDRAQCHYAK